MTKHSIRRPAVSVIIPHFNDLLNLDRCLAALQLQSLPQDRFEVIVADNGSDCGIAAVERVIDKRARLVCVNERGAGPARNGGAKAARGEILAFIDSDCVPDADWLEEGIAALADADFVGGKVVVSVTDEQCVTPTEAFERVFAFDFESYITRKGFTGSGNLFVRARLFELVGGFRTGVSEDVDWSRRATALGFRLGYAENAIVHHPARRNWRELRRKWVRINRETYHLMGQASGGRMKWAARTLLLPASAIVHAPRVLRSPRLNGARERAGALAILFLCRLWRFGDGVKLTVGGAAR